MSNDWLANVLDGDFLHFESAGKSDSEKSESIEKGAALQNQSFPCKRNGEWHGGKIVPHDAKEEEHTDLEPVRAFRSPWLQKTGHHYERD